jgi:hypothetical protein
MKDMPLFEGNSRQWNGDAAADKQIERLRELFIDEIKNLPADELLNLISLKDNPDKKYLEPVTMKEICSMTGISEYEFKKLERQGVIKPIKTNPYGLTDDEVDKIEKTGLTVDEFIRLLQYTDQKITLPELSEKANIPLRKLEKMDSEMGLFQVA